MVEIRFSLAPQGILLDPIVVIGRRAMDQMGLCGPLLVSTDVGWE
jgi:hypothetical protein